MDEKIAVPIGASTKDDRDEPPRTEGIWSFIVSISKLCKWLIISRRTVYYKPMKAIPVINSSPVETIKAIVEDTPSFGYRTVAALLGMSENTAQRIFKLNSCQVKKQTIGFRPRVQALPSAATAANEVLVDGLVSHLPGRNSWAALAALVIDCRIRELLTVLAPNAQRQYRPSSALEHTLIVRFWTPNCVSEPFSLQSELLADGMVERTMRAQKSRLRHLY